ncbi:MAG TPA: hypothetical protein PK869_00600 [Candidatus Hydrogenedentes bacterium]|nr:hypothetical protein [Candidatus Hydrogenedentota bacterium]
MFAASLIILSALSANADYQISAAKGPYFVCDSRVIMDRWLSERFITAPVRHESNPLLTRAHAWEGSGPHLGGSVLFDKKELIYRMWYSVFNRHAYDNRLPFSYNVCYAESTDGISWTRPFLGVFDYEGSTENNIIKLGTDKTQNIDVCLNPIPDQWPGKFLAIHNQKGGVFVSGSDDGKTFTRLWEPPAISYHSDTHNNFVYDEVRERWLLFCRPRFYAGDHKRRVSMQSSSDLEQWTHERNILVPGENEPAEFYGMTVWRRGDLYFGLVQVYDRTTGTPFLELAWSGDGEHWDRVPTHPAFMSQGPEGAWDAGMVFPAETPVEVGDTLRYYYGGFPLPHDTKMENVGAIGLMVGERDRFVGIRATSEKPGFVLTRPFVVGGRDLFVNARIAGELRAELRVGNNKTVDGWTFADCDAVTGTGYEMEVTWGGKSLSEAPAGDVAVNFSLHNAELFTFDLRKQ